MAFSFDKRILLSGQTNQQKKDEATDIIDSLNGQYLDGQDYHSGATHVVAASLSKGRKVLSAIASGKWLLHWKFIEACIEAQDWVDEEAYTWYSIRDKLISTDDIKLVDAWVYWKEKLEFEKRKSAFDGWRVALLVKHKRMKEEVNKFMPPVLGKVVLTGDDLDDLTVEDCKKYRITHVLINAKERDQQRMSKLDEILMISVPVLPSCYLTDYLLDPKAEDALLESYRFWETSRQEQRIKNEVIYGTSHSGDTSVSTSEFRARARDAPVINLVSSPHRPLLDESGVIDLLSPQKGASPSSNKAAENERPPASLGHLESLNDVEMLENDQIPKFPGLEVDFLADFVSELRVSAGEKRESDDLSWMGAHQEIGKEIKRILNNEDLKEIYECQQSELPGHDEMLVLAEKFECLMEKNETWSMRFTAMRLLESACGPHNVVPKPQVIASVLLKLYLRNKDPFLVAEAEQFLERCVDWFPPLPGVWRDFWFLILQRGSAMEEEMKTNRWEEGEYELDIVNSDGEDETGDTKSSPNEPFRIRGHKTWSRKAPKVPKLEEIDWDSKMKEGFLFLIEKINDPTASDLEAPQFPKQEDIGGDQNEVEIEASLEGKSQWLKYLRLMELLCDVLEKDFWAYLNNAESTGQVGFMSSDVRGKPFPAAVFCDRQSSNMERPHCMKVLRETVTALCSKNILPRRVGGRLLSLWMEISRLNGRGKLCADWLGFEMMSDQVYALTATVAKMVAERRGGYTLCSFITLPWLKLLLLELLKPKPRTAQHRVMVSMEYKAYHGLRRNVIKRSVRKYTLE